MKKWRVRECSVLAACLLWAVSASSWAAFTNVVQLVLRQGDIPTTNGVNIVGAPAYTGAVDTHVWYDSPTTAYGGATVLKFGGSDYTFAFPSNASRAYIKFELASYLPSAARVVQADLYLKCAGLGKTGSQTLYNYRTAPWDTNITWNTAGGVYADVQEIGTVYYYAWRLWANDETQNIDLTSIVQGWHSGTLSNYGLQLNSREDNTFYQEYQVYSCDHPVAANRPRLVISYVTDGEVAQPQGWNGRYARVGLLYTNGPPAFDDTYVADSPNEASNFVSDTYADVRTYNNPATPRRVLLKLNMSNPALPMLAKSSDTPARGVARLVSATLLVSTIRMFEWFQLWTCSQDWNPASVTRLTRDGVNPWAQMWTNNAISNVGADYGQRWFSPVFKGSSCSWDVTPTIQGYVDGTVSNYGFVLGQASGAAYDNKMSLTEFGVQAMRPTLILETLLPVNFGTVIVVK